MLLLKLEVCEGHITRCPVVMPCDHCATTAGTQQQRTTVRAGCHCLETWLPFNRHKAMNHLTNPTVVWCNNAPIRVAWLGHSSMTSRHHQLFRCFKYHHGPLGRTRRLRASHLYRRFTLIHLLRERKGCCNCPTPCRSLSSVGRGTATTYRLTNTYLKPENYL